MKVQYSLQLTLSHFPLHYDSSYSGNATQTGVSWSGKQAQEIMGRKIGFREDGFKIDSSCLVVLETCFEQRQTFEQRVQEQQQNHKLSSVTFMLNSGQKAE